MEHPAACSERVGTTIPAPHDLHRVASTNPRSVGASPTVGSRAAWPVCKEPIPEAVLVEPRVSILKIRSNHFRRSASVLVSLAHLRHFAIQSRHNLLIPHSAESFLRGNLVSRVSQSNTNYSFVSCMERLVMMVTQERNLVRPHPNQRFPHLSAPRR
jgi:hypothetical protein